MTVPGISSPPEAQARLLDLQAVDDELVRVAAHRRRLEQSAQIVATEGERASLRRTAAERRGELEDLRARLGRLEADVRTVEQRLARDHARLVVTSSAKDAQGLEAEIASLQRRRSALEDDELTVMEEVESAEHAEGSARAELAATEERLAVQRGDRDDALTGLLAQREDAARRREEIASGIPADLVALYDRQRTRYGIGAARLVGAVSQGSNMALTGADLAAVRAAAPDAVVLDPESSCILVRTDAVAS